MSIPELNSTDFHDYTSGDLHRIEIDLEKNAYNFRGCKLAMEYFDNHFDELVKKYAPGKTNEVLRNIGRDTWAFIMATVAIASPFEVGGLIGKLRSRFIKYEDPSKGLTAVFVASKVLEKIVDFGFVDYDPNEMTILCKESLPKQLVSKIRAYQVQWPMVTPPKKLKCNKDLGYYNLRTRPCIITHSDIEDDVYLEHFDRLNSIPFKINEFVFNHCQNKQKPGSEQSTRQFEQFCKHQHEVAEWLMDNAEKFYMVWFGDTRGRSYCDGYFLSAQGNDYQKALIHPAIGEVLDLSEPKD